MPEQVVLVTPQDRVIGLMEKMQAHHSGLLHRAFSVFLFNASGEMLLQKRASSKYHSPGLWTNAVCSHPRLGETYIEAAQRRLGEELGIDTLLEKKFDFIYKAEVGQGLWEHELDYVFVGEYNGTFCLNPKEVSEVKYRRIEDIRTDVEQFPEHYTEWFKIILKKYISYIENK